MTTTASFYDTFLEAFSQAAKQQKDMKAAFMIGSRARKKNPADQWSDLDLLIYTDTPEYYLDSPDFLAQFGSIWSSFATK